MRDLRLVLPGLMVFALCAVAPAFAQGFGIEGGITRALIHGDDAADLDGRNGLMGGIWFGGDRGGLLGFMGEITYVVKGANDGDSELKLYYLEIPAVLRLKTSSTASTWESSRAPVSRSRGSASKCAGTGAYGPLRRKAPGSAVATARTSWSRSW